MGNPLRQHTTARTHSRLARFDKHLLFQATAALPAKQAGLSACDCLSEYARSQVPAQAGLGAKAAAGDDQYLGSMGQSIQPSRGQQGVTQQFWPLVGCPVAGEQDATTLIAFVDDIVQVLRSRGPQGFEAEVVENEQVGAEVGLKPPFQAAISPSAVEVLEHLVGVDQENSEALAGGSLSDRLGRRWVLFASMLAAPLLMFVFLAVSGWLRFPLLLLLGFTALSIAPVLMALVQENYPENRALANGVYLALSFLLRSGVVVLLGAMGDFWGLRRAFAASAVISLLGLPLILLLPKKRPQPGAA